MFSSNNFTRLFCLYSIFWSVSALASDGVLEINQACVAAGCFPGDLAGFPVELKQPGSYILTSNLDVRDEVEPENVTAIEIFSGLGGFVIDLNGFRIDGPSICAGVPVTSCSPTGTGIGIDSSDNRVTVRNGYVIGMGDLGVRLVTGARVEGMYIEDCGGTGIQAGDGSLYLNNIVHRNGGNGINTGQKSLVIGNVIYGHLGLGINGQLSIGYGQNAMSNNTGGAVNAGVQISNNLCDGALCP